MFVKEKERENYWEISKGLSKHGVLSDDIIESIQEDYIWNKENDKHKDKAHGDFEL